MFCTTLRRRSSFASVIPSLIAPSGLAIKESQLETHDIALPLPDFPKITHDSKPKRTLRLLLLSPNNMSETKLPGTLSRIQHFVSLTGGLDVAIVMSLSASKPFSSARDLLNATQADEMDGIRSYALLQAEFMTRSELSWIPILPLAKLDGLVGVVKTHAQSISRPRPKPSSAVRPLDMLAHCTPDLPLPSLAVDLTSDIFTSLGHVAQAALAHRALSTPESEGLFSSDDVLQSSRSAFGVLTGQVDKNVIESMIEFWVEDWAIE
ncbi:hypothetical protein D6D10_03733 [Aureobasidium pullulans]|uniref:Uncharacterized protein n=1 Tax=Aureobasidium pullulans TaxID=5580 RepID=A0A4S9EZ06_AURPU|nr:hypothetical protein D6D10_03733 [Aureobasidium pullulans]